MGLFSAGIVLSAHITFSKAGFIEKTYKPSRTPRRMALGLFGLNIAGLSGLAECKGGVVSTCDFFD